MVFNKPMVVAIQTECKFIAWVANKSVILSIHHSYPPLKVLTN